VASQGWHQVQNSSDNKVTQTITLVMAMPLGSTTNVNKHVILWEMGMNSTAGYLLVPSDQNTRSGCSQPCHQGTAGSTITTNLAGKLKEYNYAFQQQ